MILVHSLFLVRNDNMSSSSDFDKMVLEFFNDDPLAVVYKKQTTGAFNPATRELTSSIAEISCKGILLDMQMTSNGLSTKFGTVISEGDKELIMLPTEKASFNASPISPDPTQDSVVVAGVEYNVVNMKEINPSGAVPLVYFLHIRR